ncbi:GNAT family N-acetyltransferase [Candidatus Gracilibacteria bacterium]|nr:GNAT family N-acetyltransferase [Candidatus Gracilibacteria bacterium]
MRQRPHELPLLTTDRLQLRQMQDEDASALYTIYGDPEVMRYASDEPFADPDTVRTMLDSVAQLLAAGASLEWAVVETANDQLVGTCGLHSFDEAANSAEVGCLLARVAWGRGFMGEALTAICDYARSLDIARLRADIDSANERSIRLFRRLGFVHRHDTYYELCL